MRVVAIALCIVGYTLATHTHEQEVTAKTIRSEYVQEADGNYHWAMETDTGIVSEAKGHFEKGPDGNLTSHVEGSNSYEDPSGNHVSWTYTADENGYHPVGDILPSPMPIPDYIQKAVEYIATHSKDKPVA